MYCDSSLLNGGWSRTLLVRTTCIYRGTYNECKIVKLDVNLVVKLLGNSSQESVVYIVVLMYPNIISNLCYVFFLGSAMFTKLFLYNNDLYVLFPTLKKLLSIYAITSLYFYFNHHSSMVMILQS